MTLKEAWEKAEVGQILHRHEFNTSFSLTRKEGEHGPARYNCGMPISLWSAMAEDWYVVPMKKTVWINIHNDTSAYLYHSKKDADCGHREGKDDIREACLEITYTSGEGLDG